jgi:hypothetical protein
MNSHSLSPRLLLALCLFLAVQIIPARATTVKEFLAMSNNKQGEFITNAVNAMCEKLRSPYDSKGARKSPELLKQQRELARFTIALFDERDSTGLPVAYAKIDSLVYYSSLDEKDSGLHVENIIATYAAKQFREKQAADGAATKSAAQKNSSQPTAK